MHPKIRLLSLALAAHALTLSATLISNFDIPPASAGLLSGFTNLETNNHVGNWRGNPNPLAVTPTGIVGLYDNGENGAGDGHIRMARNYSNSQRVALGTFINVADYGLLPDTDYSLAFDYAVDRVGARAYDANAFIRYAIVATNNTYTQINGAIENSINVFSGPGSILLNYSAATTIATPGQTAWTGFASGETFSFAPGTTRLAILIQGQGYGVGNNNWPANGEYTYLGLDNISIIPEPSTLWLTGLAAGAFLLLRRRR